MMNKRRAVFVTWLIIMFLVVFYLSSRLQVKSDITQFIPDYSSEDQRYSLFFDELNTGQTSKPLFIRLSTVTQEKTASLSKSLKSRLLKSDLFETVINGQIEFNVAEFQHLFQYRYLLSSDITEQSFSSHVIKESLNDRLKEIRAGMGIVIKQSLSSDPTNSFVNYLLGSKKWRDPVIQYGVWFTPDKDGALLITHLKQDGFDLDNQQVAIELIHDSVSELAEGLPVRLDISGPGTFAVEIRKEIQHTLTVLSIVGGGLVLLLLFFAYRSLILSALVGIPILSAVLIATTITSLAFGYIHGITLAFGITLLGVCLDYPVHLFSHLRDKQSPADTMMEIWPTIRLGVITTSLGYLVLLWSGFDGLMQLAVFAIVGLGVASALTRWVIPELILSHHRPNISMEWLSQILESRWRSRYGVLIVIVVSGLSCSSLFFREDVIWEQDVSSLSPIPEQARLLDQQLRRQIGVPDLNYIFILTDENPESLLQKSERIRLSLQELLELEIARDIFSPTQMLPSQARQRERQALLPLRVDLEKSVFMAVQGTPFREGLLDTFIGDVESSRIMSPLKWDDILKPPLARMLAGDFFNREGKWISIIRLSGVTDEAALRAWLKDNPEAGMAYFNLRKTASELIHLYRINAIFWLFGAVLVMALVILVYTRSLVTTTRVILAPTLAVVASLSLQVLLDVRLNLFHLLSLPLIVGIGIDYSLFFNRKTKDRYDWQQSLHGVVISAISTLITFGILILTELPVLVAIGQTVALGVLACFVLVILMAQKQVYLKL